MELLPRSLCDGHEFYTMFKAAVAWSNVKPSHIYISLLINHLSFFKVRHPILFLCNTYSLIIYNQFP